MATSNGLKRRQLSYSSFVKIYPAADLRIRVVSCHELLGQSYLIPQVCPIRILSRSDINSRSTCHLKTPFATNMFALSLPSFSLVALLLSVCPSSIKIQAYPRLTLRAFIRFPFCRSLFDSADPREARGCGLRPPRPPNMLRPSAGCASRIETR